MHNARDESRLLRKSDRDKSPSIKKKKCEGKNATERKCKDLRTGTKKKRDEKKIAENDNVRS